VSGPHGLSATEAAELVGSHVDVMAEQLESWARTGEVERTTDANPIAKAAGVTGGFACGPRRTCCEQTGRRSRHCPR
jgi:hypothetical protein